MRNLIGIILFGIFFNVLSTDAFEYCDISHDHTMCKYPVVRPGHNCGPDAKIHYLSDEEKRDILDKHNYYRARVANGEYSGRGFPKAARMMKLKWDEELANIAHRWILQCIDGNDVNRDLMPGGRKVGQNIFHVSSTGGYFSNKEAIKSAVGGWNSYVEFTTPEDFIYNYRVSGQGQEFIRLVWGETERIGCAVHHYKPDSMSWYQSKLYCNYYPGGNVIGFPAYEIGEPCSQCHVDENCSNSLCEFHSHWQYSLSL